MKRRALLLAPLAMLGVKPSAFASRGSYQFKPGEAERFEAGLRRALETVQRKMDEHSGRVAAIAARDPRT